MTAQVGDAPRERGEKSGSVPRPVALGPAKELYDCYCEGTEPRCPHHDTRPLKYTIEELESMR